MFKIYLNDIRVALSLLTRLPIHVPSSAFERAHKAVWAYGVAGAAWAICVWSVASLCMAGGLATPIAAGFGLINGMLITGAIHEDGLADCADGFWGGWERERRLEIMRDSRLGVYGTLALIVSTGLRWQLLTTVLEGKNSFLAILLAGMLTRSVLPLMMAHLPQARSDGLSHSVGIPNGSGVYFSIIISASISLVFLGVAGLMLAVIAAITALLCGLLARKKIGGQTGDVLGASVVIVEIIVLATCILVNGNK